LVWYGNSKKQQIQIRVEKGEKMTRYKKWISRKTPYAQQFLRVALGGYFHRIFKGQKRERKNWFCWPLVPICKESRVYNKKGNRLRECRK
jgi:hypothetical protein